MTGIRILSEGSCISIGNRPATGPVGFFGGTGDADSHDQFANWSRNDRGFLDIAHHLPPAIRNIFSQTRRGYTARGAAEKKLIEKLEKISCNHMVNAVKYLPVK